ncbi:hypothetical protein KIH31_15300 [Paenarthrobacter sp. DKR-5]|uniref:hypothetical protein n=1 Tax=Paenarthrobacter sp. DKR-5 TaxID=2835535 RepID=UPI001BDC9834|nr:hypothetical protein [Paenarthrobacter sp. DKR-5]MBT1003956.1 hypothetical protein [Paenarthrobacter sp. DKR-5]
MTLISAADAAGRLSAAERLTLSVLWATSSVRVAIAGAFLFWAVLGADAVSWGTAVRVGVLLLGSAIAFIHHRQDLRERLTGLLPRRLSVHLGATGVRRRRIDLPGALEGLGAILAMSLVVGPFPLALDVHANLAAADVRTIGLVLVALFTSFQWINMVLVPTWTIPDPASSWQPARRHAIERLALPGLLSGALALWVVVAGASGVQVNTLAAGMAVLLPVWVYWAIFVYDASTRAAAKVTAEATQRQRQDSARFLHLLNPGLKNLIAALEAPEPAIGEALRDARDLRSRLVTVKEDLLSGIGRRSSSNAADLIRSSATAIPPLNSNKVALEITPATASIAFDGTDWDIARFVLTDLLANAALAATEIRVDIHRLPTDAGSIISISVTDNGPGFDGSNALSDPRSSLHALNQVLAREEGNGTLDIDSRPGNTTVEARWHSLYPANPTKENTFA